MKSVELFFKGILEKIGSNKYRTQFQKHTAEAQTKEKNKCMQWSRLKNSQFGFKSAP